MKAIKLLMMGPPGVGKGTFGKLLSKEFSIPILTVGDEIRKIAAQESLSQVYIDIAKDVTKGKLINDGLAWAIMIHKLKDLDTSRGFIIDGYPRTATECEIMEMCDFQYDLVVSLKQHEEVIIKKTLARRVCESCGSTYNLANIEYEGHKLPSMKPKVKGKCDNCGGNLITRKDDTRSVIQKRLFTFQVHTLPLEKYFAEKGKLIEFSPYGGVADYPQLSVKVKEKLGLP
ncbi:unnamed protein product [Blepharisma stoltei]|uniref:Adenylate kinase active site lid domain-containing protein n=1 Tax=Blepharisma stoltei TaxID=1481888 RepID=A0AAU9JMS4_9CILI|nr:unnamed protein product [Blepharisma stoltei]